MQECKIASGFAPFSPCADRFNVAGYRELKRDPVFRFLKRRQMERRSVEIVRYMFLGAGEENSQSA